MEDLKAWLKGCLIIGGFILFGWALILLIGYIILRGVLSFLALYDHD